MPVAAVVGVVAAVATAATATTVVATAFAVAAAIGSAAALIGQLTGVKELTIAGTVLGAVGGLGSIASSIGMFGSEAATLASAGSTEGAAAVTNAAGGAASEVTQAAAPALEVTAAAPAGGAVMEAAPMATVSEVGQSAVNAAGASTDVTDMINNALQAGDFEGALTPVSTGEIVPQALPDAAINPEGLVPDPTRGLVDQGVTTPMVDAGATAPATVADASMAQPVDAFGNVLPQGDGTLTNVTADSGQTEFLDGFNDAGEANVSTTATPAQQVTGKPGKLPGQAAPTPTSTPTPQAVTGTTPAAGTTPTPTPSPTPPPDQLIYAKNMGGVERVGPWDEIWKFAKENQMMVMGGLQAASSFLSGAMSPLAPAQVEALRTQAEQNRAASNLARAQEDILRRRLSNMGEPIPVAQRRPPSGLVNMAVTGRPA